MLTHVFTTNKPNKIRHSGSAQKTQTKTNKQTKKKPRFMCNFNGKSSFSLTQRVITQRSVITLGPIFTKMVLNRVQGSKEKSQEVSVRKNANQWRYNKKCRRGPPKALLGLIRTVTAISSVFVVLFCLFLPSQYRENRSISRRNLGRGIKPSVAS